MRRPDRWPGNCRTIRSPTRSGQRHQEFGDVIAEGLYALLHSRLGVEAADEEYWKRFLEQRDRVLADVIRRLPELPAANGEEK